MTRSLLTVILITLASCAFGQTGYKKVYKYDDYQPNWALVKTISNTYGFIDTKGNVVVEPVYSKIEKFDYQNGELAIVRNVSGAYGFINQEGKEMVAAIYWSKREAIEALTNLKE